MNWEEKTQVKKGDVGERIVQHHLEKRGYIVYRTRTNKPHMFDMLITKDNQRLILCEVKTKPRRNFYPDTGIDYKDYLGYCNISNIYKLPFWLFFVDEMLGEIYGGLLSKLEKPTTFLVDGKKLTYPSYQKNIIYFHQPSMRVVGSLNSEEIQEIKRNNTRNYNYQ